VVATLQSTELPVETLDRWSDQLQRAAREVVARGGPTAQRLKNWINGVPLGHPLHPALTNIVLGAWWTAAALDVLGEPNAADSALTMGIVSAVPTALAGAADWSDTAAHPRRIGLLHGLLNSAGLACMGASLIARRAQSRNLGVALSTAGLVVTGFSAWLGGQLVYRQGTNVSRNAFLPDVEEFQAVARLDDLQPDKSFGARITGDDGEVPVLLVRTSGTVLAVSGICSHWGGPLAEGKLTGECIECPWHASQFNIRDGSVCNGPATGPLPVFETRIREGNVEVRRV
jgi:nitrite reductase/ring-hydroxylating ferredoxin subunit/uncharacterized membrane protein